MDRDDRHLRMNDQLGMLQQRNRGMSGQTTDGAVIEILGLLIDEVTELRREVEALRAARD